MGKRIRIAWLSVLTAAAAFSAYTMSADVTWGAFANFDTISVTVPGTQRQMSVPYNPALLVCACVGRGGGRGTMQQLRALVRSTVTMHDVTLCE
jgi:hypothetical protein